MDRRQNNRMLINAVYHAIAVPTAMRNRVTKTMTVALLLGKPWEILSTSHIHMPAVQTCKFVPDDSSTAVPLQRTDAQWGAANPLSRWRKMQSLLFLSLLACQHTKTNVLGGSQRKWSDGHTDWQQTSKLPALWHLELILRKICRNIL